MASCVICADEEKEDTPLRRTSCGQHWMCDACLEQTFALAMRDESNYHPRCCISESSVLLIDDYEDFLPFELAFDYRVKEREYSVQPRSRIYCGNTSCGKFIHPQNYRQQPVDSALCHACDLLTCVQCKVLLKGTGKHTCVIPESEIKFQEAVKEHKYQSCTCGLIIELAEACNHISCECGRQFCYICGKDWDGYHACPSYGHPIYDAEGYNQDGFHRDTGLNRNGQARQQQNEDGQFDEEGRDEEGFDRDGFDEDGRDRDGFNAHGLDEDGFPRMTAAEREEARLAQAAHDIALGNFVLEEEDGEDEEESPEEDEADESDEELGAVGGQEVSREGVAEDENEKNYEELLDLTSSQLHNASISSDAQDIDRDGDITMIDA